LFNSKTRGKKNVTKTPFFNGRRKREKKKTSMGVKKKIGKHLVVKKRAERGMSLAEKKTTN